MFSASACYHPVSDITQLGKNKAQRYPPWPLSTEVPLGL